MNKELEKLKNEGYGRIGEQRRKAKEAYKAPTILDKDYPAGFGYIYARLPLDFRKRLLESLRIQFYYELVKENSEVITVNMPTDERIEYFESMGRLKSYLLKDIANEEG